MRGLAKQVAAYAVVAAAGFLFGSGAGYALRGYDPAGYLAGYLAGYRDGAERGEFNAAPPATPLVRSPDQAALPE